MAEGNKKRKGGRPRGSKNKTTALARADKGAAAVVAQVCALKAQDKLYTPGKDNLANISPKPEASHSAMRALSVSGLQSGVHVACIGPASALYRPSNGL